MASGLLSAHASLAASSGEAPVSARRVHISSQHQTYDGRQSKIGFQGKVYVTYQDIRIEAPDASVDTDPKGNPKVAHFFNRPIARRHAPSGKVDRLIADTLHLYLDANAVRAEGRADSYVTSVASDPFHIRSDVQQFDNNSKTVAALGRVHVTYKDTQAYSPRALLQVNQAGKAERVVFLDGARLEKPDTNIKGGKITILVDSGNLVAEQDVLTHALVKNNPGLPFDAEAPAVSGHHSASPTRLAAAPAPPRPAKKPALPPLETTPPTRGATANHTWVIIKADYQQYDKASETMLASGNVHVTYQDYIATGPKATFKMKNGQLDRITLSGRGNIIDRERSVTADRIVITINPKHFDAEGNVKSAFLTKDNTQTSASSPSSAGKTGATAPASAGATTGKPPGLPPIVKPSEVEDQ